ncbi:MAG TPA: SMR family transporter [Bacteroidales bacterium]|nr:SMR family transporter [Bacteroidales bacterium]
MHWLTLVAAGLFEVAFAFCLGKARMSGGMAMWWWYAGFVVSLLISMALLIRATQVLPIGTAYAVWTATGAANTFLNPFPLRVFLEQN